MEITAKRSRSRSKAKAISPIIATLILIVITVVAGVALYGFVSGFMAKTTSSTGTFSSASLSIQAASVSATKGFTILVTNTGSTPVTVTAISLINGSTNSLMCSTTSSIKISPSTTVSITGNSSNCTSGVYPTESGGYVIVQVMTSGGAYVDYGTTVSP
ncbi:archaellin/type IV pilin N-terminal domain-containing protein [Conexivisphaera calida]|uniref:Archaeal Type IV pilin N-terminal domain-containing protein n=1 Tax=Conexivisphaera calida TaxID=1874277 RepID=A0A4P2VFG7_9ARCH|nr:archaellin/type IV pilin N-terminal domain-containing protein [Conexivisphaera calida]BBE42223.1 hypothetical protein NAS2_0834 [Conexivisphaera calida]